MNGKNLFADPQFMQEELYETQRALFTAKTVREMKFLQNKLNFLKQQMKGVKKNK